MAPPKQKDRSGETSANMSKSPRFCICTVQDSFAHTGFYIIDTPFGPNMPAVELMRDSGLPLGSRSLGGYMPNAKVLVCYFGAKHHAVILGAVPEAMESAKLILPDALVLCSMAGICQDPMHYSIFANQDSLMSNHSCGRASDTLPGDWGHINDLGLSFYMGRILAGMRASDLAKIEAFWGDDLVRLTAYNYELFNAGAEEQRYNDEGEYNEVIRRTPFSWEGMGLMAVGDCTQQTDGKLEPNRKEALFEPKEADQLIIPRHIVMRGYLGDIEREYVCAPPAELDTETFAQRTKYTGLLEIIKHVNGAYSVRSAKEITLEKTCLIAVPKELIAPDDPLGDNQTNYKAADMLGSGEAYDMAEFVWGETDAGIRAAQLFDYHAWFYAKYTLGGLAAHTKDWYLPEESELDQPLSGAIYDQTLDIKHKFMAQLPTPGNLVIDQRPGHSVKYYRSRSIFKQFDDGSILLEDGWGSQIQMKGGSIFLTAVGDIWNMPGRNAVTWAPHDAIVRAGNSVDISASKKDVRIKADRNLHLLAGNSDEHIGGILLESKSEGLSSASDYSDIGERVTSHGVTIKCPKSSFHVLSGDAYIGVSEDGPRKVLCLDAGKTGNILNRGQNSLTHLYSGLFAVAQAESSENPVFVITSSGCQISTPTQIGGAVSIVSMQGGPAYLLVDGTIAATDNIITKGSIAAEGTIAANGAVASKANGGSPLAEIKDALNFELPTDAVQQQMSAQATAIGDQVQSLDDAETVDEQNAPGSPGFADKVGFSFRDTTLDIKLDDTFVLYESRWQQMLRKNGGGTTWIERPVTAPNNQPTYPHPGQGGWQDLQAFGKVDEQNFDWGDGKAKARDAITKDGQAATKTSLESGYLVNVQD